MGMSRGGMFWRLIILNLLFGYNESQNFSFWLRCCKADNKLVRLVVKFNIVRLTRKYGLQIPETCQIGVGLELPHSLSIVIHYNASIGKNCTIHQFVCYYWR